MKIKKYFFALIFFFLSFNEIKSLVPDPDHCYNLYINGGYQFSSRKSINFSLGIGDALLCYHWIPYGVLIDNELIFKKNDTDNLIYSPKLNLFSKYVIKNTGYLSIYTSLSLGYFIEFNNHEFKNSALKITPGIGLFFPFFPIKDLDNISILLLYSYNLNIYDNINNINTSNIILQVSINIGLFTYYRN
jgi:hypothetical protein